jgi:hypothetical protein
LATNRNISDDILLAVAMNGLKPELKTIVMTKEPKNLISQVQTHSFLDEFVK